MKARHLRTYLPPYAIGRSWPPIRAARIALRHKPSRSTEGMRPVNLLMGTKKKPGNSTPLTMACAGLKRDRNDFNNDSKYGRQWPEPS